MSEYIVGTKYWEPVHDEQSAKQAAKMGGLPVLIMGANTGLFWISSFAQTVLHPPVYVLGAIFSVIFIIFAFRIRAGKFASLPYLAGLFVAYFGISLLSGVAIYIYNATQQDIVSLFGPVVVAFIVIITSIIPVIAMIVSVNGIRGWNWLRKNNVAMQF